MAEHDGEQELRGFILRPGTGRKITIPGVPERVTVKAAGAGTGGVVSFHEVWHGPEDTGVPRHLHRHLDEMFYLLEGEMRILLGEDESVGGPGTFVYIPRGTIHAWRPTGTGPVRDLLVVLPGGFEGYFDEMQTLRPPHEDPGAWRDLHRRWDVEVVGPPLES